mmetsp:Transcript_18477/g.19238  ORF Transcript_18477/g.19238 Transcript_18477/m.19238 type:complete len:99 (-) Transcript_18477:91-387(-)
MADESSNAIPVDAIIKDKKHYPGANQGQFCWQIYNEYLHCLRRKGSDSQICAAKRGNASLLCPSDWLSNWDELRDKGVFPGVNDGKQRSELQLDKHHH